VTTHTVRGPAEYHNRKTMKKRDDSNNWNVLN
jgi:hypothetical protein